MSIKGIFRVIFGTLLLSLIAIAALAISLVKSQQRVRVDHYERIENLRLIREMRDSNDYFTQFALGYLNTGNQHFKDLYLNFTDMWDGKKPRPVFLEESYIDIERNATPPKVRLRPAVSFIKLVDEGSFTPHEHVLIEDAERLMRQMRSMEQQAFQDFAQFQYGEKLPTPIPIGEASSLLTGDAYRKAYAQFRTTIATIIRSVHERATDEIADVEGRTSYLLYGLITVLTLLCINALVAYRTLINRVILPISYVNRQTDSLEKDLDQLVQVTRTLAKGDLDVKFEPKSPAIVLSGQDEIGRLVRIHNGMLDHMKVTGMLIAEVALDLRTSHEQAASADRAKSEFLANMTHEIRTPMNAIVGFSELLVSKVKDPVLRNYTEGIRVGSKNLLQLINDILDLSKIESGYLEITRKPFQIAVLQRDLMQMFSAEASQKNVRLSFSKTTDAAVQIQLDESRLRQVLINLVGNALKFTNEGFVHVEFLLTPSLDESKRDLVIRVQDTGIGIDSSEFERIFKAFSQAEGQSNRKYGGTGLGLTISRRIVELMGGQIDVESKKGKGSCFSLYFPNIAVERLPLAPDEVFEPLEHVMFEPAVLVIGEDVESNLQLLKAFLEPYPFTVYSASDGQSVLDLVRQHNPDLLLLDLQMPVIDGKELLTILRADDAFRELSIVVLTASTPYLEGSVWEAMASAIIRKPLRSRELFRELRKFLRFKMELIERDFEDTSKNWTVLSAESMERLRSLLRETEGQLQGAMDLDHIEEVSQEVYALALNENHEPLKGTALSLLEAIEDFNMQRIKTLFDEIKMKTHIDDF
ncbi:MAG: response regulator [Chitinophagaceae bacterium]|nr:response regulator [Oligoflexus sp.]